MSRQTSEREQLIRAVTGEGRKMSTRTLLFHTAVTERLGLNPSDHKCAEVIYGNSGPMTAGRLAELTGLSTGAITGVLDRLEKAGFVRRGNDPADRRRVVIEPTPERAPNMSQYFLPLAEAMAEVCAKYTSEELSRVLDFMRRTGAAMEQQMLRVRALPTTSEPARDEPAKAGKPRRRASSPEVRRSRQ